MNNQKSTYTQLVQRSMAKLQVPMTASELRHVNAKTPRRVKTSKVEFLDYTPGTVSTNAVFKFAPSPVQINKQLDELCEQEGDETPLDPFSVAVSKAYADKMAKDKNVNPFLFTNKPFLIPSDRFSVCLPSKEFGNTTGKDWLLESDPMTARFFALIAENMVSSLKEEDAKYIAWLMCSHVYTMPGTQMIVPDADYEYDFPEPFLEMIAGHAAAYLDACDRLSEVKGAEFGGSLKPLKSPGFDRSFWLGLPFPKKACYLAPSSTLLGRKDKMDKNAVVSYSYAPLKMFKAMSAVKVFKKKLTHLRAGSRQSVEGVLRMTEDRVISHPVHNKRINGPDAPEIYDVDIAGATPNAQPARGFHIEDHAAVLTGKVQGKQREHCILSVAKGVFRKMMVSPLYGLRLFREAENAFFGDKPKTARKVLKNAQGNEYRNLFSGSSLPFLLRTRGIFGEDFLVTVQTNAIWRSYLTPLETSRLGFPTPNPDSEYRKWLDRVLAKRPKSRLNYRMDVSHFETFATTNVRLKAACFGSLQAGDDMIKRAVPVNAAFDKKCSAYRRCCFILSSMDSWLPATDTCYYVPMANTSGGPTTSLQSLMMGAAIQSYVIYLKAGLAAAERVFAGLMASGAEKAYSMLNEPLPDRWKPWLSDGFEFTSNGRHFVSYNNAGSDDMKGYIDSDDFSSDEELEEFFFDDVMKKHLKMLNVSFEAGDGTSFAEFRGRHEARENIVSTFSKAFLLEFGALGDAWWLGFFMAADTDSRFREAVDKAAADLGLGRFYEYATLCAKNFIQNIAGATTYKDSAFLQNKYPEESPIGALLKESLPGQTANGDPSASGISPMLLAAGAARGSSLKVPECIVTALFDVYHKFLKGGDFNSVNEPSIHEAFPNYDVDLILKLLKAEGVANAKKSLQK